MCVPIMHAPQIKLESGSKLVHDIWASVSFANVKCGSKLGQSNCLTGALFPDLNSASPTAAGAPFPEDAAGSGSKLGQSNCFLSRRCNRDVESGSKLGQSNFLAGALFPEDAAEMSNLDLNSASPTAYRWYSLSRRCSRGVQSGSKLGQSNFIYLALSCQKMQHRCRIWI